MCDVPFICLGWYKSRKGLNHVIEAYHSLFLLLFISAVMRGLTKWTFICAIIASFFVVSISAHPTPTSLAKRQDDTDVNDYHNSGKTKTTTTASSTSSPTTIPRPNDGGHGSNGSNGSSTPQVIAVGGASWYGK